ncbi:MAG: phage portal protein [Clostridia bacterium]|nr:phage portal protein [Clostridia bacterium]
MITRDRAILKSGLSGRLLQGCLNEHMRGVERLNRLRDAYLMQSCSRRPRGEGLPDHQLHHAYARYIVTIAASYLAGTAVAYQGEGKGPDALRKALQEGNAAGVDLELARQCALYGKGVELVYADSRARPRAAALDPRCAFTVYSDDAEATPLFGVHFHPVQDEGGIPRGYQAQVYTGEEKLTFQGPDFATLLLRAPVSRSPHYFGRVPLIEYWNNEEEKGDVESVLSLIDAYDTLQSCRINDQEQLSDALLIVYGARLEADERGRTPAQQLRQDKLLYLPDREAGAQYLVKQGGTGAEEVRTALERDIHKFSMIPDLSDEQFSGNVSGVAMRYKLLGLEQLTRGKERWFREGLQERLRCFAHFLSVKGLRMGDTEGIRLIFTRTLPENALEAAQMVKTLEGMVPDSVLLSQLPFLDGQSIPENEKEE